uniref:Uncharacterized protein n=1 Tax=Rhabditophanes sp. KR3021 TaxID=114890 RepID=A0AC35TUB9_9BILA
MSSKKATNNHVEWEVVPEDESMDFPSEESDSDSNNSANEAPSIPDSIVSSMIGAISGIKLAMSQSAVASEAAAAVKKEINPRDIVECRRISYKHGKPMSYKSHGSLSATKSIYEKKFTIEPFLIEPFLKHVKMCDSKEIVVGSIREPQHIKALKECIERNKDITLHFNASTLIHSKEFHTLLTLEGCYNRFIINFKDLTELAAAIKFISPEHVYNVRTLFMTYSDFKRPSPVLEKYQWACMGKIVADLPADLEKYLSTYDETKISFGSLINKIKRKISQ